MNISWQFCWRPFWDSYISARLRGYISDLQLGESKGHGLNHLDAVPPNPAINNQHHLDRSNDMCRHQKWFKKRVHLGEKISCLSMIHFLPTTHVILKVVVQDIMYMYLFYCSSKLLHKDHGRNKHIYKCPNIEIFMLHTNTNIDIHLVSQGHNWFTYPLMLRKSCFSEPKKLELEWGKLLPCKPVHGGWFEGAKVELWQKETNKTLRSSWKQEYKCVSKYKYINASYEVSKSIGLPNTSEIQPKSKN